MCPPILFASGAPDDRARSSSFVSANSEDFRVKRSVFLAASASAAVVNARAQARPTGVPGGVDLVERAAEFDRVGFDAIIGRSAEVRQLWEALAFHPALFNGMKNALNGLHFGFGYPVDRIALVVAAHGPSSVYTFSETIWARYGLGKALKLMDAAGDVVTSNVFLAPRADATGSMNPDDPHGFYQDTSVQTLQRRGVIFLTCHTAVEEQSRRLVQGGFAPTGMTEQDVARDILTSLIPGAVVVPSMSAAIAVIQGQFRYTYTSPAY
jgi:hypothetical protein